MKKKIIQVIGTRPNIIKFVDMSDLFNQVVVWTGQHYDPELKDMLLEEFNLETDYCFLCTELGSMITKLSEVYRLEKPDAVVVYGDTRSGLAGAMAAHDNNIKVIHVEAGVRCYDIKRPEERARRAIDEVSELCLCPTQTARENLSNTLGLALYVGDVHYDRYCQNRPSENFTLLTLHRQENVDNRKQFRKILSELPDGPIIFPVHPRTKKAIQVFKLDVPENVKMIAPIAYKDMQKLIRSAKQVITDSGGVSREAWFSGTPVKVIGGSEWSVEINSFGDGNAASKIREYIKEELDGKLSKG